MTDQNQMSKKGQKMTSAQKLTTAIPVRLYESEGVKLKKHEAAGLNMSDIIRRCVRRSLPDVVKEIREEIARIEGGF